MRAKPKPPSQEFEKFEALARKVVNVPKKDIQEQEKKLQTKRKMSVKRQG